MINCYGLFGQTEREFVSKKREKETKHTATTTTETYRQLDTRSSHARIAPE